MRICPKCEYVDPPYWKHLKWSYYLDSCSFENFEMLHPELVEQLLSSEMCEDKHYVYRLSKSHKGRGVPIWVIRKAKIDYGETPDSLHEKFPHTRKKKKGAHASKDVPRDFLKVWDKWHPNQKKLFEEQQP